MPEFKRFLSEAKLMRLVLLAAFVFSCSALADAVEEYTVKAGLTLNFARFTEWPEGILKDGDSTINLCISGDEPVQQAFTRIAGKPVGNRRLLVANVADTPKLELCHLLYLSGDAHEYRRLLSESRGHSILTLGEDVDFLSNGGMVDLEMVDGKISIVIDLLAVKKVGLVISSRVLKLATIVNP